MCAMLTRARQWLSICTQHCQATFTGRQAGPQAPCRWRVPKTAAWCSWQAVTGQLWPWIQGGEYLLHESRLQPRTACGQHLLCTSVKENFSIHTAKSRSNILQQTLLSIFPHGAACLPAYTYDVNFASLQQRSLQGAKAASSRALGSKFCSEGPLL